MAIMTIRLIHPKRLLICGLTILAFVCMWGLFPSNNQSSDLKSESLSEENIMPQSELVSTKSELTTAASRELAIDSEAASTISELTSAPPVPAPTPSTENGTPQSGELISTESEMSTAALLELKIEDHTINSEAASAISELTSVSTPTPTASEVNVPATESTEPDARTQAIDIVYMWVNGSDPALQDSIAHKVANMGSDMIPSDARVY